VPDFISEDELRTFEGWLRYQGIDVATAPRDELADWRDIFDDTMRCSQASPKFGLMKLQRAPGEHRYAVAVREGSDLWLTLWVRRSKKGEFFVLVPRSDQSWDPHTSYHLDGTLHMKSFGHKGLSKKLQPLTGTFRGTEHLGVYAGHGPKSVGAICDPAAFSGVVEVARDVLGPRHGQVVVDLVAPKCEPSFLPNMVQQEVFRDNVPWVIIRIVS
jgi:hypothetical protein